MEDRFFSPLYLVMKSHNPLNEEAKREKNLRERNECKDISSSNNELKRCARQSKHGESTQTTAVLGKSGEARRGGEVTVQLESMD